MTVAAMTVTYGIGLLLGTALGCVVLTFAAANPEVELGGGVEVRLIGPDGETWRWALRQHHALVKPLGMQRLHADARVGAL